MTNNIEIKKNNVLSKLTSVLNKQYRIELAEGLLKLFAFVLFLFFAASLFEIFNYSGVTLKFTFVIIFTILFLFLFFLWVIKPLFKIFKPYTLNELNSAAKKIGNHFPQIKDNLLNSLQLLEDEETARLPLTSAAFGTTYKKIEPLNFLDIIDYSALKKSANIFLLAFSFLFFSVLVFPQIRSASLRLLYFNKRFIKPSEFSLSILSGNIKTKKGNNVQLKAKASGKIPRYIFFSIKKKNETEYTGQKVSADTNGTYTLNLKNIKESFRYFAGYKNEKTKDYIVKVLNPPVVNSLQLKVYPPKYSGLPGFTQNDDGNLEVLPGTKISLNITSNKKIKNANLIKNDSVVIALKVNNTKAFGNITVRKNFVYHISLSDTDGNKNENPITYDVKTLTDNFPLITMSSPQPNSLLPQNDLVRIACNIKDDYGFTKLTLNYKISESLFRKEENGFASFEIPIVKTELEQNVFYTWNVSELQPKEKDIVSFYLEIFDNDNVNGPKSVKSELYKIRVPSLDELFLQAEISQNKAVENLTETLKESEKLKERLKEVSDELKQNEKKINWNEKEKIEQAVEKFKNLAKKVDDIKQNLNKMQQSMTQNNLLSEETMKKYNELQKLMEELNSEALQKALEKMQQALQKLNRTQVQNNLENFAANEELFKKSLERTLNLLKRIQIEQKVDEVIKRTEKLTKDINKLTEETKQNEKNTSEANKNKLTDKQKNIDEQLKKLQKELDKLNENMKEIKDMPQKKMNEIKENFEKQKNSETSRKALEELQKNSFQNAMQKMQQLSNNMNATTKQMQQLKKEMQMQNQQMVMMDMMKAINNLISTSKAEEKLQQKTELNKFRSEELSQMTSEQMDISQNLDNILRELSKLSQKTFAVTPEMGKALGKARQEMKDALNGLQNRNGNQASYKQSQAMKSLNEAAMLMQNSLQQMMQGGGQGGGMMSLMQQLQKLSQRQMSLNQLTQQLKQGQLTLQQQAAMQRLAEEQGRIQKSLDELNKEARQSGESKKIASNLEKVLEDMKEVISGLSTQKLNDELIHKQERILSKLLDAQRSINERDYEKKRESEIGKAFNTKSPSELNLQTKTTEDNLREELIRAVKEGYSKDYQNLIRKYFDELRKTGTN